eukprot:Sspe_Gene.84524::Locus_55479_Transcript_1_1_Confidence_1.000_Length_1841::g.84524::m.84524/K06632/WEE1; wee1-like protein kinase
MESRRLGCSVCLLGRRIRSAVPHSEAWEPSDAAAPLTRTLFPCPPTCEAPRTRFLFRSPSLSQSTDSKESSGSDVDMKGLLSTPPRRTPQRHRNRSTRKGRARRDEPLVNPFSSHGGINSPLGPISPCADHRLVLSPGHEASDTDASSELHCSPLDLSGDWDVPLPPWAVTGRGRLATEFECEFKMVGIPGIPRLMNRVLAHDSNGVVYLGYHKLDGMQYAVKVVTQPIRDSNRQRQQAELGALTACQHDCTPHILGYHDSWVEQGHLHIQTEMPCYGNLADPQAEHTDRNATLFACHIQEALSVLHGNAYAHCGVRLGACYSTTGVDSLSGREQIVYQLGDFGTAVCTKDLPPEQVEALRSLDYWSLALTLLEFECPQSADDVAAIQRAMRVVAERPDKAEPELDGIHCQAVSTFRHWEEQLSGPVPGLIVPLLHTPGEYDSSMAP